MVQITAPVIITSVSVSIFVFAGFVMGLVTYLNPGKDQCEMTYMFEYPQYIPVPMSATIEAKFPKYKLYLYGEGNYARQLKMGHIHGIPIIFVAGNAGCHKQVRSLASVAYRMHEDLHKMHHFNYYTVGWNEEFSGLYGGVLYSQTEYLREVVLHVQRLYKTPTKVILIGHSMGGLVAKSVFVDPNFPANAIDLVITLATPHKAAPYTLDWNIHIFYRAWSQYTSQHPDIYKEKVFVSISSGTRDRMIQPYQTVIEDHNAVNVVATHVPGVQISTDHLQVVWCRQLVKVLCLTLFDLIDSRTLSLTTNTAQIRAVFRRDLLGENQVNKPGPLPTRYNLQTIVVKESSFSRTIRARDGWQKIIIAESTFSDKEMNLVIDNPPKSGWLYHCVDQCVDITSHTTRYLTENSVIYHYSKEMREGRVVVYLNPASSKTQESTIFVNIAEKGSNVHSISTLKHTAHYKNKLVELIKLDAMIGDEDYWISGRVSVVTNKCDALRSNIKFPVSVFQHSFENKFSASYEGTLDTVIQKLTLSDLSSPPLFVLLLDPHCQYSVEFSVEVAETTANLIRYEYHLLLPAVLYAILGVTAQHLSELPANVKPDYLAFIEEISNIYTCSLLVGTTLLTWLFPSLISSLQSHIYLPNWMTLRTEILIIILLTTFVMCFIVSSLCRGVCSVMSHVLKRTKLAVNTDKTPPFFTYKFQAFLLIMGTLTTGSLVLIINVLLLLITTCSISTKTATRSQHQVSISFLLLNFIAMLTSIPTFASWIKNLTVGLPWLEYDSSIILALVSSSSCVMFYKHPGPPDSLKQCVQIIIVVKYLVLTCLFTHPYMVPFVYYMIIFVIACYYFMSSMGFKKNS